MNSLVTLVCDFNPHRGNYCVQLKTTSAELPINRSQFEIVSSTIESVRGTVDGVGIGLYISTVKKHLFLTRLLEEMEHYLRFVV